MPAFSRALGGSVSNSVATETNCQVWICGFLASFSAGNFAATELV